MLLLHELTHFDPFSTTTALTKNTTPTSFLHACINHKATAIADYQDMVSGGQ